MENRTDGKRPQLSDLRESGAIEQDADIVCFIHRPEYYTKSSEDASGNDIRGLAEFIIAKHRSGAVGDVKMRFRAQYARFENWSDNIIEVGTYESSKLVGGAINGRDGNNNEIPSVPQSGDDNTGLPSDFDFSAGPGDLQPPY